MFNRRKPDEPKSETLAADAPAQADFLSSNPPPEFLSQPDAADDIGLPPLPRFPQSHAPQSHAPQSSLSPYQLAALKETSMARSPFAPPMPPSPLAGLRPAGNNLPTPPDGARERRTLVVGRGISVQGTVQDAERLVVEGTMEATMVNGLIELFIPVGGVFKGEVEVDEAEVAGVIDGTLTARNALIVRTSGRVLGTARCRRLQVEDGGQITGRIEMLSNDPPAFEAK